MKLPLPLRLLLALVVSIGLAALLLLLLYASELGLEVWAKLRDMPVWFAVLYVVGLVLILAVAGIVLLRLLVPRGDRDAQESMRRVPPASATELDDRILDAEQAGVDAAEARAELDRLHARREAGEVHLALFGEVSTGKSSIVQALLPDAHPVIGARAGTTRDLRHYEWISPAGDRLIITDLPGLADPQGGLTVAAREEAQRAHVVVYLVDGDLTREQHEELQALLGLGKPVILALNKSDLYSVDELERIKNRLAERLGEAGESVEILAVSAGGEREVLRRLPDGREEQVQRRIAPRVEALTEAVQRRIDADPAALEQLRDAAVFVLAADKLDEAVATHRRDRAQALVAEYSRKAVIGALAALTPGSDLVIQGVLGMQLIKKLCAVYEVPVREVDVTRLLEQAGRRVGKALPLVLAVAGNGLKAFPGIGTVTGGLVHAVAYGLIFDSLGRAVADTLAARGALPAGPTLQRFEEGLGEDLEARARRLAELALEEKVTGRGRSGAD